MTTEFEISVPCEKKEAAIDHWIDCLLYVKRNALPGDRISFRSQTDENGKETCSILVIRII